VNRRLFLSALGIGPSLMLPAAAVERARDENPTFDELWSRPREIWVTRPKAQESGRFVYWADGAVIDDGYNGLCKLMRDLHDDKSVAMHIGLLNFQYVIQQGINHYFGAKPYILHDAYRTSKTNAGIENAYKNSQHLTAAANDGHYEQASIEELYKLAQWFGVGGVGIYPRHVHIDAGPTRRWAGSYGSRKDSKK